LGGGEFADEREGNKIDLSNAAIEREK